MKTFVACSVVFISFMGLAFAHDNVRPVIVPFFDATIAPKLKLGEVDGNIDTGKPLSARSQLAQRCKDTQDARYEACPDQACKDEVDKVRAVCDQLPTDLTESQVALGILEPCNGTVPIQQCGGASPACPLGADLDGDGLRSYCG